MLQGHSTVGGITAAMYVPTSSPMFVFPSQSTVWRRLGVKRSRCGRAVTTLQAEPGGEGAPGPQAAGSPFKGRHSPSGSGGSAARNKKQSEAKPPTGPGVRINKCLVNRASRREADKMVSEGRIRVNGKVAETGTRVHIGDTVTLDYKTIRWETLPGLRDAALAAPPAEENFYYVKYWKPAGVTCTTDRSDASNILDVCFGPKFRNRIFPVGRLDKESTGLILLTSDGRLPQTILNAKHKQDKVYLVTLDRAISDAALKRLGEGVTITTTSQRDRKEKPVTAPTLPCGVVRLSPLAFRITLQEGRNRQIRRMCEAIGHKVVALHRESVMGISLKGLREGEWKELNNAEMRLVRQAMRDAGEPVKTQDKVRVKPRRSTGETKTEADLVVGGMTLHEPVEDWYS